MIKSNEVSPALKNVCLLIVGFIHLKQNFNFNFIHRCTQGVEWITNKDAPSKIIKKYNENAKKKKTFPENFFNPTTLPLKMWKNPMDPSPWIFYLNATMNFSRTGFPQKPERYARTSFHIKSFLCADLR